MLKVVTPELWKNGRRGRRRLALSAGRGWRRVTLLASHWDGTERRVKVMGIQEREVPLHTASGLTFGWLACDPTQPVELSLEATRVPSAMLLRITGLDSGAMLCRPVLPASLLPSRLPSVREPSLDERKLTKDLAEGNLPAVLERLAMQRLAGHDVSAAASRVMRFLADHPLLRGPALGALMAALCDHRGTI